MAIVTRRGRISAASELVTVTPLEKTPRLRPPHDLTDEEVEVWQGVVEAFPADWFSTATAPLLTQYCRHAVHARRIAELMEKACADPQLDVKDYDRLLQMQSHQSATMALLAVKMRICQSSITNQHGNRPKTKAQFKPWEG